ncbi:MAG TPA: 7-carboxy-7-deazaguanine synthase QueE [Methanofastidiosum sp.]|nr:7-carboxy-7-deazaguanine synthase QueE [Methanofastidiosum sp.]
MKIHSIFQACEGEGQEVGIIKTFIRTQGCSVGCRNCDTPTAVNFNQGQLVDTSWIVKEVESYPWKRVTITGGEPLEQPDILNLCHELRSKGYFVTLETSGQIYNEDVFDCCSFLSVDVKTPSTGVGIDWDIHRRILSRYGEKTQIKGVVEILEDFKFIKKYYDRFFTMERILTPYQLVITPCWKVNQNMVDVDFIQYLLSLIFQKKIFVRVIIQQHKLVYGSQKENV